MDKRLKNIYQDIIDDDYLGKEFRGGKNLNGYIYDKSIDNIIRKRLQEKLDSQQQGGMKKRKYYQSPMDKLHESLGMEDYWIKRKGAYGTKAGASKNPWVQFIKSHKGEGYDFTQLARMYHEQKGGIVLGGATRKARKDESRAMKRYWDEVKHGKRYRAGYGTKKGASKNPWIKFLKHMKGKGYSLTELSQMYDYSMKREGYPKEYIKETIKLRPEEAAKVLEGLPIYLPIMEKTAKPALKVIQKEAPELIEKAIKKIEADPEKIRECKELLGLI